LKVGKFLLDFPPQLALEAQAVFLSLQLQDRLTTDFQEGVHNLVKINA